MTWDVVIIGGGPAGATAALYAARAELKTLVLDKGVRSGALGITSKIANYPGVAGEMSGADLVEIIRRQAASFGAEFRRGKVVGSLLGEDPKQLILADGETVEARAVILATGAMGRTNTLPGEQEFLGRGVSYCATCDGAFFRDRDVLVAGSTAEAGEEALFLTRFARTVYVATPKNEPPGDGEVVEKLRAQPKVKLLAGRRLARIEGNGSVERAIVRGRDEETFAVSGVFVYGQGNRPITDYAAGHAELTQGGCAVANAEMSTPVPGVFACGDILCNDVQQAVVAAAQGCIAALAADKYLNAREKVAKDYR